MWDVILASNESGKDIIDELDVLGKECKTLYCKLENSIISDEYLSDNISAVKLIPVTGRSHQLRVHMAQIGHPILGDRFYASEDIMNKTKRLCLHAFYLKFSHPLSNQPLEFTVKPDFLNNMPAL